jgi:hypothetical protein
LRIPYNFNNEINVIGIDGKSLGTFDPKTDKGKWEEIVRKQLSKSPEETPKESPKESNGIDGYE